MSKEGSADQPPPVAEQDDFAESAEMTARQFRRAISAEFFAMFFFVFVCVGCALTTTGVAEGASPMAASSATLAISLCFGLTIFVLVHIFGHISGAHINPAVTCSLLLARLVPVKQAVAYIIAQCLGSIAASGVLMVVMGLTPGTMGGFNVLSGPADNKIARGFVTEMILTMILCLAVFATVDPATNAGTAAGPLAIGMAVGIAHLVAVPITGCGINPARSLGPALFSNADAAKADLWVFLIAPLVGAAFVAIVYPRWFAEVNFSGNLRSGFHTKEAETHEHEHEPHEAAKQDTSGTKGTSTLTSTSMSATPGGESEIDDSENLRPVVLSGFPRSTGVMGSGVPR